MSDRTAGTLRVGSHLPSPRSTRGGPCCPGCGGSELYTMSRDFAGERLTLQACRRCQPGSPLVRAFDRATDQIFAEC